MPCIELDENRLLPNINNLLRSNSMNQCKICHAALNQAALNVREEMYALGETFEYRQCPSCGCLQLMNIPDDLSKYYPKEYHNHIPSSSKKTFKSFRRGLKRKLILEHPKWLSPLLKLWLPTYPLFWIYRRLGMRTTHKVLDVGSGYGEKILEIQSAGVKKVLGVDLFVSGDIQVGDVKLVKKGTIEDIEENFDIIIFHHSLEHMPDQLKTLQKAGSLLNPGGRILVRIPTVSSQAFIEYQEKWYQLDAPRHLYLHSHESFKRLAEAADLSILDKWCDSTELQFIISEQYKKGISLFDSKSYIINAHESGITPEQVREFKQKAEIANRSLSGDQICIVLGKSQHR